MAFSVVFIRSREFVGHFPIVPYILCHTIVFPTVTYHNALDNSGIYNTLTAAIIKRK